MDLAFLAEVNFTISIALIMAMLLSIAADNNAYSMLKLFIYKSFILICLIEVGCVMGSIF
jgi:hypothetical protein